MVKVSASRYSPNLHEGDGQMIDWKIGERTRITSGQDKDRIFVIQSETKNHKNCPTGYVREGYFEDDPSHEMFAKAEAQIWFAPGEYPGA